MEVFLDPTGGTRETCYLVLCFRRIVDGTVDALRVPLSYIYDPLTPAPLTPYGDFPFGLERLHDLQLLDRGGSGKNYAFIFQTRRKFLP